jgi:hypothetical protein
MTERYDMTKPELESLPDISDDEPEELQTLANANGERMRLLAAQGFMLPGIDALYVKILLEYLVGSSQLDKVRLAFNVELERMLTEAESQVKMAKLMAQPQIVQNGDGNRAARRAR